MEDHDVKWAALQMSKLHVEQISADTLTKGTYAAGRKYKIVSDTNYFSVRFTVERILFVSRN